VRTIFISGLPEDMMERELQNLLRLLPRYEASQVNCKGEHPMGFALFTTPPFAIAAKDALQEMVFDEESKSVLHTEMAKKNLFVKRDTSSWTQKERYNQSRKELLDLTALMALTRQKCKTAPEPPYGCHGQLPHDKWDLGLSLLAVEKTYHFCHIFCMVERE
ncbi:RNA-binding protein with multiple splicing 2, partial [Camellia lanceoleosa]